MASTRAVVRAYGALGRDRDREVGHWWQFLLAGPCLVAIVIAAAAVGVEAWSLGVATVLAGIAAIAIGLALGIIHLRNHRIRRIPA